MATDVIICFLSGIWTYLKLLLMALCYWLPPRQLPVSWRGVALRVLDATGKWCLADTQMLTILMVAMHFDIQLPSSTAGTPAVVDVLVIPCLPSPLDVAVSRSARAS